MTYRALAADLSLTSGFVPIAFQVVAAALLVWLLAGRRSRRWWVRWVPLALVGGLALAGVAWWYADHQGWIDRPPPFSVWLWIGTAGLAAALTVLGWREIGWEQRTAGLLAGAMALLCSASSLNQWTQYLPTVNAAGARLTGAGPAGTIDLDQVNKLKQAGTRPDHGTLVELTIPSTASGFDHRDEYVYLPPSWYDQRTAPLPVVVMVHAEFGGPDDWPVSAKAVETLDAFASAHDGNAPVVVFVDIAGTFSNDTECVNGRRGMAADHITKDVVPFMISNFGVSQNAAQWGIAGWSSGGTCALILTTKYPELFKTFVDIDGQRGPYAGDREQTVTRLFDGDEHAWGQFDPRTLMTRQPLDGISGWFATSMDTPTVYRAPAPGAEADPPVIDDDENVLNPGATANYLCELGSNHGMECAVVSDPGVHSFQNAGDNFAKALPWLAGRLNTPGVTPIPLPAAQH
ncbi:MAG: alpha/beta hydrolase-fold protein [Mycobacterium sp.]